MIAVANVLGNYEDIEKWVGSKKKAAPLIAKIQTQIVAGEERVRNQNLSNLSSPA
jgi:hypothetical protein